MGSGGCFVNVPVLMYIFYISFVYLCVVVFVCLFVLYFGLFLTVLLLKNILYPFVLVIFHPYCPVLTIVLMVRHKFRNHTYVSSIYNPS